MESPKDNKGVTEQDKDADEPTHPQGKLMTATMQELLKGVRGKDRQRLKRLTSIMDQMNWNRIKSRDDMIMNLLQGEADMVSSPWLSWADGD